MTRNLSLWRNWLARSAVNRKVGGSSPPRDVSVLSLYLIYENGSYNHYASNFEKKSWEHISFGLYVCMYVCMGHRDIVLKHHVSIPSGK